MNQSSAACGVATGQRIARPATAPRRGRTGRRAQGTRGSGQPQQSAAPSSREVAQRHGDAVQAEHVARQLTGQRAAGSGRKSTAGRDTAARARDRGLAEMAVMAEVQRAIEMDRQQERHAGERVDDEIVHPPASRDEEVHAVVKEDQQRVLPRGDEERGGHGPVRSTAKRDCDGRDDERPLDEERGQRREMERGARSVAIGWPRVGGARSTRMTSSRDDRAEREARTISTTSAVREEGRCREGERPDGEGRRRRVTRSGRASRCRREASIRPGDGGRQRHMTARKGAERRIRSLDEREQRPGGHGRASGDAGRNQGVEEDIHRGRSPGPPRRPRGSAGARRQ